MSLAQGFPSTFSVTEQTHEVLHNLDNETKKIYTDVNNIMSTHAHTGNGSDGAKIDFSSLSNVNINSSTIINTPAGNIAATTTQAAINEIDNRVGAAVGIKNKIINGEMMVDQRNNGLAQTFTAGAAIAYCVDRFYASCTGANITGQRITGAGIYKNSYQFTGLASNTGTLFGQRIESFDCRDIVNKTVACQVELSSNAITTVTWTAYYANTVDTFSAKTQIATGTITITSTPTVYSFTFNTGTNAGNGIAIEFTTGALLATKTLTYSGIQLEKGSIATTYEMLKYVTIVELCQRYFIPLINFPLGYTINAAYCYSNGMLTYPIAMRISPVLTAGTTYTASSGNNGTAAVAAGTLGASFYNSASNWNTNVGVSVNGGLTAEL